MNNNILIKNIEIIDLEEKFDGVKDILIENGILQKVEDNIEEYTTKNDEITIIDGSNYKISPGLVDMHVHCRDFNESHKETLETVQNAALAGGFTSIAVMPNTDPVIDNSDMVKKVLEISKKINKIKIMVVGALTKNLEGKKLNDYYDMKQSGITALSNDGIPIDNPLIFKNSLLYSKDLNLPILCHSSSALLSKNSSMNESLTSTRFGLIGEPNISESISVFRDIEIANYLGVYVHICHVSAGETIDVITNAKNDKKHVTCETAPHYFILTDEDIKDYDTNFKVNPPLRSKYDRNKIIDGLKNNTIDVIASDHAPHHIDDKLLPFPLAKYGIIGLETSFCLSYTYLVKTNIITLKSLIKKMSYNPSKILGIESGFKIGSLANLTIFDINEEFVIRSDNFKSKARNTPFDGFKVFGKIKYTISNGKIEYKDK